MVGIGNTVGVGGLFLVGLEKLGWKARGCVVRRGQAGCTCRLYPALIRRVHVGV